MLRIPLLVALISPCIVSQYFYKRTLYGDANESSDYVNSYYGLPSISADSHRRRLTFPHDTLRQQHPFDFGPVVHIGDGASDRERVMAHAKAGVWRRGGMMEKLRVDERKRSQEDGVEIRSKFADLHKRLVMKNKKLVSTTTNRPIELSKKAKKLEKEARKIVENSKMSNESKIEKLDKLMLKAPDSVKTELAEINDSGNLKQQSESVVESRPIRISEDGKTIEF